MEDKLLFILVYLKQAPTQEVQGSLFGMRQPKANLWIHLLHAVLNRTLAGHGDLPKRDVLVEVADRDAMEADMPAGDTDTRGTGDDDTRPPPPFFSMMEPSDQ
jgi:hypothetical protein